MKARMLGAAEIVDAFRLVPRVMLIGYGWIVWDVTMWFMALQDPSAAQMGFVSTVWGAAGILSGWYMSTGRRWDGAPQHHLIRSGDYGSYSGPGPINQPPPRYGPTYNVGRPPQQSEEDKW